MAYKMENEELPIARCSIADLTVKQGIHLQPVVLKLELMQRRYKII